LIAALAAPAPAPDDEDDLDQSIRCLDALEAELTRVRAGEAHAAQRFADLSDMIAAIVAFDYSKRVELTEKDDIFDGFAVFLNMLVEELSVSTVSTAYVNNIIESMSALVLVLDEQARIKTVNDAVTSLCGHARSELLGQPIQQVFPDVDVAVVLRDGVAIHLETSGRTKAGASFPALFSASLMRNRKRQIEGIVCIGRDLTESKRAEEERLRMRDAMQRQAILVEELSTPLIPITDDVVVMPLVGTMDQQRAERVCEALLRGVVERRAKAAIIDVTGVRAVDRPGLEGIVSAAKGLRLVGAEVILTGIRPEVAAILMSLDVDLRGIVTSGSLQSAIVDLLRRFGKSSFEGRDGAHHRARRK
jgi:rsbT co-antagonist protein RsbR